MRRQALLLAAVLCSLALLANATAVEVKATSAAGVESSVALEQRVRSELDSLEAALLELDADLEDDEDEADEIPFNDTDNDGDDSEDKSESEGSDGDDGDDQQEQEEGAEDDSEEEGEGSDDGASKKDKTDKSKSKNKRSKRRSKRSKKNKVAAPVVPAKPLADGAKKGYQLPAIIANFTVPTVSGSACPKGSYQVFASTSNSTVNGVTTTKQNITVTFTSFSIRSGLGIATARNTHDCSFSALVHKPVGLCNFASSGSYEGTIYLRDQAQLELKRSRTTTNDLGKKQSANSYKVFKGPKDLGTPFKPHFPKVKMVSAMSEGDLKLEHTLDATLSPSKAAGLVKFTKLSVELVMECRHK